MRFSAAMTAERFLPQRLALRARPLLGRLDAEPVEALSSTVRRRIGIAVAILNPVEGAG